MKTTGRVLLCLFLSFSLLAPARAQPIEPGAPAPGSQDEALQPKFFIWGLLMNIAFKFAMSAFSDWYQKKMTNDLSDPVNYKKILFNTAGASLVSFFNSDDAMSLLGIKSVGAAENTVQDLPTKPIQVQDGQPNYQGVHVALVGFDRAGKVTGLQPVTAGFHTGDRIKLKVLPTFDGLLVIENINPQGVRRQIYPPTASQAVSVKGGAEIFVPLGENQFFEFAGVTGDEQLVITVRDPRAFGAAESKVEVSRKDERDGSSFVQETSPGTYPVIAQSIKLRHDK